MCLAVPHRGRTNHAASCPSCTCSRPAPVQVQLCSLAPLAPVPALGSAAAASPSPSPSSTSSSVRQGSAGGSGGGGATGGRLAVLRGHEKAVRCLKLLGHASHASTAQPYMLASGGADGRVKLWDVGAALAGAATGSCTGTWKAAEAVTQLLPLEAGGAGSTLLAAVQPTGLDLIDPRQAGGAMRMGLHGVSCGSGRAMQAAAAGHLLAHSEFWSRVAGRMQSWCMAAFVADPSLGVSAVQWEPSVRDKPFPTLDSPPSPP